MVKMQAATKGLVVWCGKGLGKERGGRGDLPAQGLAWWEVLATNVLSLHHTDFDVFAD